MSTYTFRILKGKYQLSVVTTDKEFIEEQFAKWVYKVSDYVQKHKVFVAKEKMNTQLHVENELNKQKINEQLQRKNVDNKEVKEDNVTNKQKDLDIFYAPVDNKPKDAKTINQADFDNIFEDSLNKTQSELSFKPSPSIKKDNAFFNYISSRKVQNKMDYLLLTAYYFTQYEQKPRFTLKQLNAKLMQNLAVILDHSVIQEAINRDYIECLPDLTGVIGASEYRLTGYGEKVLLND